MPNNQALRRRNRGGRRNGVALWRPYEENIFSNITTTAATATTITSYGTTTLLPDYSGSAIVRTVVFRKVQVMVSPVDILPTTTTPSPQLFGQLLYVSSSTGKAVPLSFPRMLNKVSPTVFTVSMPRSLSETRRTGDTAAVVQFVITNSLGATAVSYVIQTKITSWCDVAIDSFS